MFILNNFLIVASLGAYKLKLCNILFQKGFFQEKNAKI